MELIRKVIDKYFEFTEEEGGNFHIAELVPESMIDRTKVSKFEGMLNWMAIESTVIDGDLLELEAYFGHTLPESYKSFLQHRHFIEIQLGEHSIGFFKNLPGKLLEDTKAEIADYYENLIERGYLPFAVESDYGVVCFDANDPRAGHEYPIVTFDHEDGFEFPSDYESSFVNMFEEFDEWLDNLIAEE